MAVWMPVTVVPRSLATVAIDTFITELSRVIRNWPAASVMSTAPDALLTAWEVAASDPTAELPSGGAREARVPSPERQEASGPLCGPEASGGDPPRYRGSASS